MNRNMAIISAAFLIMFIYDLQKLIRKKEQAMVFIIYIVLMAASITVSLLIAAGMRPPSPAQWIEGILKMVGVVK